jgi:hypothetical protein
VVNRIIDELDRPIPEVVRLGSLRDICRELGLKENGRTAEQIKKAFFQNAHTVITAKLDYKGRDGTKRRVAESNNKQISFTRYSLAFTGATLPNGQKADAIYIILNPPYREVLNNAPVRPLNYDYLKQLNPAPQRFYELISRQMFATIKYGLATAKLSYAEYCEHAPQQRYFDYEHVKKQMYKVHRPHLQSGYLEVVNFQATTCSEGKPDWLMLYTPGPKAKAEYQTFNGRFSSDSAAETASVEDAREATGNPPSPAEQLVAFFRQLFQHAPNAYPSQKELDQANMLITQHGYERARHIVEYAHRAAAETKYQPQTFSGILHYATPALASFEETQKRTQAKTAIAACKYCNSSGHISFREQDGHEFSTRCPHDAAMIEARMRREQLTRIPPP